MSQKYFSNRITINEIKDDIGIMGNSDPAISRLEKPGIQRLGNSAIVKVNRREMQGFIDKYDNDKKGFGTFNQYNSNPNASQNPSTKTLHYRDPANPIDNTLPDTNYKCFDGIDKPSKGQIVVVESPYFKDEITGDIRITDGGLSHAGVTFPPVGTFGYFAYDNTDDPPDGWLECAGQAVVYKRKKNNIYYDTEYTHLYNIIDSWGTFTEFSDIRPTATEGKVFIMPDLRGYFVRGLNITDIGLDNNTSKDKRPYLLSKNSDVIDHVHSGENPYSRVEKIDAKNPDRNSNQEMIWFRRPNRSSHRNSPYGEWVTSQTAADRAYRHTQANFFQHLPWLPEESNGYSNVYYGDGGGKFSNDGETASSSRCWGQKRKATELYIDIDWRTLKGGPPGYNRYDYGGANEDIERNDYGFALYAKGPWNNYNYLHREHDSYGNSWGSFSHIHHYPYAWCEWGHHGYNQLTLSGSSSSYYGHSYYSWAQGEHGGAGGVNFKYANEISYYWERLGGNNPKGSNSWSHSVIYDYVENSWNNQHNQNFGWDYWSGYDYRWRWDYGGYIQQEANGNSEGDSGIGWDHKDDFARNPWRRSFNRHMHGNVFTFYRSLNFPDPRPNHMGEWYGFSHNNHILCSQNITRRNEIHWSRLRVNGGCEYRSGWVGNMPTSETDHTPHPNSLGYNSGNKQTYNSMQRAGFGGITRRRYTANHNQFGVPHSGGWDYLTWNAFCFITKPKEGETGLLNSGDNGNYTTTDGDHNHEIFGAENGVFYQGQEETRPHNIALRFFVKY